MKWTPIIFLIILTSGMVLADEGQIETYKPNQKFQLVVHLSNFSGDVTQANCSAQIRNQSQNILDNLILGESAGGYYNATYNKSKTGTFFCRYNCTQGSLYDSQTCDFTIKQDENMAIAIIIVMGIVITFLFVLSRYVKLEPIKYLLISVAVMVLILTINIGILLAKESLPSSIQSLLSTTYLIVLYTIEFIMGLAILFLMIYYAAYWLPQKFKAKKQ